MTFSYSGNPSSSTLDEVRFLIGDTDTADQQLSNEEILYLIVKNTNALPTAIEACGAIVAKYTRKITTSSNIGQSSHFSQLAAQYRALQHDLENNMRCAPWVGGDSVSGVDAVRADTDRPQPAFELGMLDNPNAIVDTDTDEG